MNCAVSPREETKCQEGYKGMCVCVCTRQADTHSANISEEVESIDLSNEGFIMSFFVEKLSKKSLLGHHTWENLALFKYKERTINRFHCIFFFIFICVCF